MFGIDPRNLTASNVVVDLVLTIVLLTITMIWPPVNSAASMGMDVAVYIFASALGFFISLIVVDIVTVNNEPLNDIICGNSGLLAAIVGAALTMLLITGCQAAVVNLVKIAV